MGKKDYRDDLLDASYEAVKLEIENTEKDLERLQRRAEKLRAAAAAIAELLPADDPEQAESTPAFLRQDNGSVEGESHPPAQTIPSDAARATA